jgi:eukaryotic-like serine/threonine-protein kinase
MRLGPYEILLCIARGGMASVWAARQHGARGFSRLVALKTILPELAAPDLDGMFLDEARVTSRIHHPNVCEVFELIEHGGVLALSMEWVDGDTLHNILGSRPQAPALDTRVAAQIIAQVAYGLHAAHELRDDRGAKLELVHRDVSPQNILISRSGHVKVTDFGVAKSLGGVREATAIGKVKGKLSYMSPEQAQGQPIDRRSDLFSLGVVLYLATVGSHPFRRTGESRHQQLSRLLTHQVMKPSDLIPDYPPELEAIVLQALSSDPAGRFATADEMARRLQNWVLASGPLVTEHQIAQMVLARAGAAILERSERIANLMCTPLDEPAGNEQPPSATDPTLVPTTSRSEAHGPGLPLGTRATLRAVSTTLTAAAVALGAGFVFSTPKDAPRPHLAAPVAQLSRAAPPTPAPALVEPTPPVTAVGGDAATGADVPSTTRPATRAAAGAALGTRTPKLKATAVRSGKSQKAIARRKHLSSRDNLYGIKRGR